MFVSQIIIFITFLMDVCIGTFVLCRNPANIVNRRFCVFTYTLAAWILSIFLVLQTADTVSATFRLRMVFSAALFIPSAFFFFTSIFPDRIERPIDRYLSIFFFAISALMALFSYHIVESVYYEKRLPHAVYGPLFPSFWFYFITCMVYSLYNLYKKSLHYYGIKKLQIQYLYFGVGVAVFLGALTNFILPTIGVWQLESFVPIVTIPIPAAVAYAIIKYHLMDIDLVIKRSTVYGTLTIVLSAIYLIIGLVLGSLLPASTYKETITTVVATTAIVLSFVPTRELIQQTIEKTLFRTRYSHPKILSESTEMFSSIHDLNGLLSHAVRILYDSIGIEKICILLEDEKTKHYCLRTAINFSCEDNLLFYPHDPIIIWLCQNQTVLSKEQLSRFKTSELVQRAEDMLATLDVDSCIPIFEENDLYGIILLGRKVDKKPFSEEDIQMFLAFSGQLAMALHNAQLYARLKESKTFRDNILQNLKSGIIVFDDKEEITLINKEAKRILGLENTSSDERRLNGLSEDIYQMLRHTLKNGAEYQHTESLVSIVNKEIPCDVTIISLKNEVGEKLGALMILTDLTELKLLQAERQHAERLAYLGTLTANIAHEIRNPLVAISTYFQLLPQKKDDEEFQKNFQDIAKKELKRINKIVENMLNIAKPSKLVMRLIDPNQPIRDAVNLLKNVAGEKGVEISINFEEKSYKLIADEEQIKQVVINILQNGLDALTENGHIDVSTNVRKNLSEFRRMLKLRSGSVFLSFASTSLHDLDSNQYFVIKVSDNGTGIPAEKMEHLFEPFFTTKDKGTGLGLAIIYGIIKEHSGAIYVESSEGKGTDFYICLPREHKNTIALEQNL